MDFAQVLVMVYLASLLSTVFVMTSVLTLLATFNANHIPESLGVVLAGLFGGLGYWFYSCA